MHRAREIAKAGAEFARQHLGTEGRRCYWQADNKQLVQHCRCDGQVTSRVSYGLSYCASPTQLPQQEALVHPYLHLHPHADRTVHVWQDLWKKLGQRQPYFDDAVATGRWPLTCMHATHTHAARV